MCRYSRTEVAVLSMLRCKCAWLPTSVVIPTNEYLVNAVAHKWLHNNAAACNTIKCTNKCYANTNTVALCATPTKYVLCQHVLRPHKHCPGALENKIITQLSCKGRQGREAGREA